MALVLIENLVPGMVVKHNVKDRSGRLLLTEGTALEAKHLGILRMWGVMEVEVNAEAEPEPDRPAPQEDLDAQALERAAREIAAIFVHNDPEHPCIRELMHLCTRRRAAHEA